LDALTCWIVPFSLHDALPIFGVGILGSILLVDLTYPWLQGATRWIPAAAVALPLALWSAWYLGRLPGHGPVTGTPKDDHSALWEDRKSTRLNSSHVKISYAVF